MEKSKKDRIKSVEIKKSNLMVAVHKLLLTQARKLSCG
jgi:hypothetical protein